MKKTNLICFSGPDGAGKTTQIKLLLDDLKRNGECVKYIHVFSKEGSFFNHLIYSHRFFSRTGKIGGRKSGQFLMPLLKLFMTILDSWITYIYIKLRHMHRTVICDRYFYDNIAYIAASEEKLANLVLRLSPLIPKPDVGILLHARPEFLYIRKKDQDLNSLQRVDSAFKTLAAKENLVAISTETGIATVHNRLKSVILGE